MKATEKKAIIYDDKCPMCAMYTAGFIRWGLLKKENRVAFAELDQQHFIVQMDPERSRDEIPLVDLDGGKTIYGLDALLFMLKHKLPFLPALFRVKPVYWFFKKLYRLISYNRRVIVGGHYETEKFDCAPHFNLKYRLMFIVFGAVVALLATYFFGEALAQVNGREWLPGWSAGAGWFAVMACGSGWLLHEAISAATMSGEKRVDYLGQLATLKIIGVAPLFIAIAFQHAQAGLANSVSILAVALSMALMTWQHLRRMKNNGWSKGLSLFWAASLLLTMGAALLIIVF